jgi:hypothetical protein
MKKNILLMLFIVGFCQHLIAQQTVPVSGGNINGSGGNTAVLTANGIGEMIGMMHLQEEICYIQVMILLHQ